MKFQNTIQFTAKQLLGLFYMEKIEGSVIICSQTELRLLVNSIDPVIKLGYLKKSDQKFWSAAYNSYYSDPNPGNLLIPFDDVFDAITGIPNPDIKAATPLKFSRSTRNNRIKSFLNAGILKVNETPKAKLNLTGKGKIYSLVTPDIASLEPVQQTKIRKQFAPKHFSLNNHSDKEIIITEIDKIYSHAFATQYLDTVLAPDSTFNKKTIEASLPVTGNNNEIQRLRVSSTCYDNSKLMTPKDKIVAKYFQSAAIQFMWENNQKFIVDDAENRFTFNLRDILISTGGRDSGAARAELYRSIIRVCSNKFELDGEECPDFMERAGFVDENGNTMDRAYYTHLTLIGETNDLDGSNLESARQTPLYITLSIPDKLYMPTRKALILLVKNEEYSSIRPQLFRNNEKLEFKEKTGYQDTLSDFLKLKVVYGNNMKSRLKRVLTQWLIANKKQSAAGAFQFFRAIDNCMIYYTGRAKSTRSQYKYRSCMAYFSEFVVECVATDNSGTKQFASVDYEVTFHHVFPNQAKKIRSYLKTVNTKRTESAEDFTENLMFVDFEFSKWFKQTMTAEGMAEAKRLHLLAKEQKHTKQDGLMISPITI